MPMPSVGVGAQNTPYPTNTPYPSAGGGYPQHNPYNQGQFQGTLSFCSLYIFERYLVLFIYCLISSESYLFCLTCQILLFCFDVIY